MIRRLINDSALQETLNLNFLQAIKTFFQIPSRTTCPRLWFGVTRLFNGFQASVGALNLCDTVNEYIALGMIPESTDCEKIINHVKTKHSSSLGLVVSAVDYFELGGNALFLKPIATTFDWKKQRVEQFILPIMDRTTDVPVECLLLAIDKIHQYEKNKKCIYIHCKAGKKRSAILVASTYMALFDKDCVDDDPEKSLNNAINKIESSRKQIEPDEKTRAKSLEAIKIYKQLQKMDKNAEYKESKSEESLTNKVKKLLTSTLGKFHISQLPAFKELAIYAAYHDPVLMPATERSDHIRHLFSSIYLSTDAGWLLNYKKLTEKLVNADPSFVWDPNGSFGMGCVVVDGLKRKHLVNAFYHEIVTYLATAFNCTKEQLNEVLELEKPEASLALASPKP